MKKINDLNGKRIVISRTDSIGDVMLTLPMVSWLKEKYPYCHIIFLCRNYTSAIVEAYNGVDEVLTLDSFSEFDREESTKFISELNFDIVIHVFPRKELAKLFNRAKVRYRVGTSHRGYHFLNCNIRPGFTRKRSPLHEAQLNFELLRPFGLKELPSMDELNCWTKNFQPPKVTLPGLVKVLTVKTTVILHPKSQGSAREWPMVNYAQLSLKLAEQGSIVFFTGTENEGKLFRDEIPAHENIIDTTGKLTIAHLMTFIEKSDALVACSTGPLHISGFLGTKTVGLYSPKIPIHPGRWKPLGDNVIILVNDPECEVCKSKEPCDCIADISVDSVFEALNSPA